MRSAGELLHHGRDASALTPTASRIMLSPKRQTIDQRYLTNIAPRWICVQGMLSRKRRDPGCVRGESIFYHNALTLRAITASSEEVALIIEIGRTCKPPIGAASSHETSSPRHTGYPSLLYPLDDPSQVHEVEFFHCKCM